MGDVLSKHPMAYGYAAPKPKRGRPPAVKEDDLSDVTRRRKPPRARVNPRPLADDYAAPGERIAEVTFPSGRGCLISCRIRDDGAEEVVIYRADRGVRTWCDSRVRTKKGRGARSTGTQGED